MLTPTAPTGRLFVLSGPSGVGKDAVLRELLGAPNALPGLRRCVTATTRSPRGGEIDGVHYRFLSREQFARRRAAGWFLEDAEYGGELYGTPREAVESIRADGADVILNIDVQGGLHLRSVLPDAVLVFLMPPSLDVLVGRLQGRGTETPEAIEQRRLRARDEIAVADRYDYVVVNDLLCAAVDTVRAIVVATRAAVSRIPNAAPVTAVGQDI